MGIGPEVPDNSISVKRVSTPTSDALLDRQQARIRGMFLPGLPAGVCARALAVSPTAAVLLQVIGLQVKLRASITVLLRSSITRSFGLKDRTVRRTLDRLETAGLVTVSKSPGRRSSVTLADIEYRNWLLGPRQINKA
jgi:DNA-binding transcriptional ArsR family regulator